MAEAVRSGRFVVLEHDWNGVHWDFMLEAGDDLRTWAMNAPPAPGQDLPARALADHRLAYLTYEGPVSGDRGRCGAWPRGRSRRSSGSPATCGSD